MLNSFNKIIIHLEGQIKAFYANYIYKKNPIDINILSIEETIDFIKKNHSSAVRFGDGEIDIISGKDIRFQEYDKELAEKLLFILSQKSSEDFLVCAPDVFGNLKKYVKDAEIYWALNRYVKYNIYKKILKNNFYGNSFISRPYIIYKNKNINFNKIRSLWDGKEVLIIEGSNSRSGVGNDLFDNARSISRIICPPANAYSVYEEIKQAGEHHGKNKLVLIMLGPTAKLLAHDLSIMGIQAIDIGHIDSEYEWFNMKAKEKVKLPHKHTAEFNDKEDIDLIYNEQYNLEIIQDLSLMEINE